MTTPIDPIHVITAIIVGMAQMGLELKNPSDNEDKPHMLRFSKAIVPFLQWTKEEGS